MIFKRFTRYARRCLEAAIEEARELGHDSIGDEDLLLGVLAIDDCITAEALNSLGVSLEVVREEAEGVFDNALASVGISLARYAFRPERASSYATRLRCTSPSRHG